MEKQPDAALNLSELTADIVAAHVSHNSVPISDLPLLISSVHAALAELGATPDNLAVVAQEPAVPVKRSVKPDHIICLEDGKKLKMLKRHLMTHYQMTPEAYRTKWNLPADYPMVAPDYAEKRRVLAKSIGLGRKPGSKVAPKPAPTAPKKAGRPRKKLSVAIP
ncbi:putative MucR family transcriptional regulator [Caenibius tardaugens NBRC 16725]|uniref:Putative MucR family transcriptional regulator n=1 Tax=Caenibius tardaugens NBRC 16725 TaxID=1219035 RepID=U2YLS2_9SPHN|nr:MucR family transcriptional regulator [Caenibius tardaugens]AZI37799.1 MucR family transcriptional regulator [Caenibius tardaugens NBRC 16725]GAD49630.1 putative MucR family transcriptional regulator [Caenibius tardaugens NBRC 16725]